jgi:DNA-binding transcriptional ArsR family regulator
MARNARPDADNQAGPPGIVDCARRLRALADPDRLRILAFLVQGARNVSEVAVVIGKTLALASHHLGVLYRAGIVQCERNGRLQIYRPHANLFRAADSRGSTCLDFGCCRLSWPSGASLRCCAGPCG